MVMSTLMIKNAALVACFDDKDTRTENCDIFVRGNRIEAIGQGLAQKADKVIDASGMLVMPGMINCHHHMYQTLTRCVPRVQEAELFPWLVHLYEIWRELSPEALYWGTMLGIGELLLTGCTTSTDHYYVFPEKCPETIFDEQIKAARALGLRFQPTRGSMSRGKKDGGLPPNDVVQTEEAILADCERVIKQYHDPDPLAMTKIALAPCSPFSVTSKLLEESVKLARRYGVRCHTHLAETQDEDAYCLNVYGKRPFDVMEDLGWVGPDIWYAHCVYLNSDEIKRAAKTGTGVSHCPASNCMLGSGIAPIPEMVDAGVPVGLGVDGSASNDSSDMLGEARNCYLVNRYRYGVGSMNAKRALTLATRGGARVLGYKDLGRLEVGMGADIIGISLRRLGYAGALSDPVAAVVCCGDNHIVDFSVVNGEQVVDHGKLVKIDEMEIWENANKWANIMLDKAEKNTGVKFRTNEGPGLVAPRPSQE